MEHTVSLSSLVETLPAVMPGVILALLVVYVIAVTFAKSDAVGAPNVPWQLPAFASLFFFVWSVYTIVLEGPTGFWTEHTRDFWGNQI